MKPYVHAKNSVRRWGGIPEDYLPIHNWFDQTKVGLPDVRHRAILHSAFGIFLLEQQFGVTITNSDGKKISVRDIGEDHVVEDLGFIPTLERWLEHLPFEEWMTGCLRGKGTASDTQRVKQRFQPGQLVTTESWIDFDVEMMNSPGFYSNVNFDPPQTVASLAPGGVGVVVWSPRTDGGSIFIVSSERCGWVLGGFLRILT